jgi:hypothetical protein
LERVAQGRAGGHPLNTVSQAPSSQDEGWHAQFSPSAAERWMECPGSIAASRGIERRSNFYADEGSAAHVLASRCFDYNKPAAFWIGEGIQIGDNVFEVTEDMASYVQAYVDDCLGRVAGGTRMHEQRVYFSESIGVPDQGGTSDFIALSADCKRLTVEDLKYGMGVRVDATENRQLMTYAVATLETLSVVIDLDQLEDVTSSTSLDWITSASGRARSRVCTGTPRKCGRLRSRRFTLASSRPARSPTTCSR